jgi:hypothetical protein
MRIRIHPETTDGKPIPGTGAVVAADTPSGLVELMRLETPFNAEMTLVQYRDEVLLRTEGPERGPLPEDAEATDIEFLTRLAQHGRIEFLPEEMLPEPAEAEEASVCAVK